MFLLSSMMFLHLSCRQQVALEGVYKGGGGGHVQLLPRERN